MAIGGECLPQMLLGAGYAEFVRYVVASAAALGVDLALVYGLTGGAGFHYLASGAIAFVTGAVVIYLLSVCWVFKIRRLGDRRTTEFTIFVVIGVIGLAINEVVLFSITEYIGAHYMVSKVFAVSLCFAFNFVARKLVLFW